jgi:hypothetical protein
MADEFDDHPGDPQLGGLGDLQREMVRVYKRMRRDGGFAKDHGNALMHALNCIASVMQDRRDSLWTKRADVLWREREAKQSAQPAASH